MMFYSGSAFSTLASMLLFLTHVGGHKHECYMHFNMFMPLNNNSQLSMPCRSWASSRRCMQPLRSRAA